LIIRTLRPEIVPASLVARRCESLKYAGSDNCVGNGTSEVSLSSLLHLLKDHLQIC
jgi:hypothetical protein